MVKHFAAITSPERLGTLLRAIHSYNGTPVVNAALRLLPLLLLRPGELRQGEWAEIDLAGSTWAVPAARMKRQKVGKLYGKPRIFNDLLSSQPLCFNLFGELTCDLPLASAVVNSMTDGRFKEVTKIDFEWSPGRRESRYLNDRSAFDVFLRCRTAAGGKGKGEAGKRGEGTLHRRRVYRIWPAAAARP